MKPRFYRLAIICAIISLCGLIAVQSYWFIEAYSINENQFDEKVNLALRSVAGRILNENGSFTKRILPVRKTSSNRFFVNVGEPVEYRKLDSIIRKEFSFHDIQTAFHLSVYNESDSLILGSLYPEGSGSSEAACLDRAQEKQKMNFAVTFTDKKAEIISSMSLFIFSAGIFALVLVLFGLMILDLSRQKKIAEIKNDFINNMTHELKTPITNISMAAEVLRANTSINEEKKSKYLQIIQEENTRMKRHVEEVLQTALMDRGQLVLSNDMVDLHKILQDVISNFRMRIQDRGGSIELSLDASRKFVKGDVLHLTNLFYNLLDNAEKYSREAPVIRIFTMDENEGLRISIEDKGIGISSESQNQIFEKFYRAYTGDKHDVKGFGLGLSYVAKIVSAHRGRISVTSELNKGSRFDLSFPSMTS